MRVVNIYLLTLSLGFLAACQSLSTSNFDKVENGMSKHQVLDILGNPNRSTRWKGKDRWTYVFVDGDKSSKLPQVRDLLFENGRMVFIGEIAGPEVSAEQRDLRNETSNLELEAKLMKDREAQKAEKSGFEQISGDEEDDTGKTPNFKPID